MTARRSHRRDTRYRRGRVGLALVAILLAALAACSTISSFDELRTDLEDGGFDDVTVTVSSSSPDVLVVSADAPPGQTTAEGEAEAKETVWTSFPRRFDKLELTVDGQRDLISYAELEQELGPRPERLNSGGDLGQDVTRLGVAALIVIVLGGVVVVALIGVGALVLLRGHRRATAARTAGPWAPPADWGTAAPPGPPSSIWGQAPAAPGVEPGPGPVPAPRPVPPVLPVSSTTAPSSGRPAARGRGRRPRGPRPPATQMPRGWEWD